MKISKASFVEYLELGWGLPLIMGGAMFNVTFVLGKKKMAAELKLTQNNDPPVVDTFCIPHLLFDNF